MFEHINKSWYSYDILISDPLVLEFETDKFCHNNVEAFSWSSILKGGSLEKFR